MKFIIFTVVLLTLPMLIMGVRGDSEIDILFLVLSVSGFGLSYYGLSLLLNKAHQILAVIVIVSLLLSSIFIRSLLALLYDFTGRGFTDEFFSHIELKSVEIGLSEYDLGIAFSIVVLSFVVGLAVRLIQKLPDRSMKHIALVLVTSTILIYLSASGSPEMKLAQAYYDYTTKYPVLLSAEMETKKKDAAILLEPVRHKITTPVLKRDLHASLPEQPVNLVLVYLESFNDMLTQSSQYPGLTPHIDAMKTRYYSYSKNYSSAYVTIEGIVNSQCGTLMNMSNSNSSLSSYSGRLPALPCMGDVLHQAGYQQLYLGGTDLGFAGKGDFLREHGYDEVLGWKHWVDNGYKASENVWGLPDTILFQEALQRIHQLRAQPGVFNLTLLTVGTHVPGFHYKGCPRYKVVENEPFLDAIHCTDYLLGKFVRQLETSGVLQDTVLFIQGDHGVFPNHDMKRLFGDAGVKDRRIFTLLSVPDYIEKKVEYIDKSKAFSTLAMAASLLDVMQIKHNAEFILAKSLFLQTE